MVDYPPIVNGCGRKCETYPIVYLLDEQANCIRVHKTGLDGKYWMCGMFEARCADCLAKLGYVW